MKDEYSIIKNNSILVLNCIYADDNKTLIYQVLNTGKNKDFELCGTFDDLIEALEYCIEKQTLYNTSLQFKGFENYFCI